MRLQAGSPDEPKSQFYDLGFRPKFRWKRTEAACEAVRHGLHHQLELEESAAA